MYKLRPTHFAFFTCGPNIAVHCKYYDVIPTTFVFVKFTYILSRTNHYQRLYNDTVKENEYRIPSK